MLKWRDAGFAAIGAALTLAIVAGVTTITADDAAPDTEQDLSPNKRSELRIAAIGDSFISGEGVSRFWLNTNTRANECRRSWAAYPYVVAVELSADLQFVACSGARIENLVSTPKYPNSASDVPGGKPQLDELADRDGIDVLFVSIGGNDSGFFDIVKACVSGGRSCDLDRAKWMTPFESALPTELANAYQLIATSLPHARVFVMTYPQPLGPTHCNQSLLNPDEYEFLRTQFIPGLNSTISRTARDAGFQVIDLTDVFEGLRICEVASQQSALNRLELRTHNSFHPNEVGHALIAREVVDQLEEAGIHTELETR